MWHCKGRTRRRHCDGATSRLSQLDDLSRSRDDWRFTVSTGSRRRSGFGPHDVRVAAHRTRIPIVRHRPERRQLDSRVGTRAAGRQFHQRLLLGAGANRPARFFGSRQSPPLSTAYRNIHDRGCWRGVLQSKDGEQSEVGHVTSAAPMSSDSAGHEAVAIALVKRDAAARGDRAVGRTGRLVDGCCHGRCCDLRRGVIAIRSEVSRLPLRFSRSHLPYGI